MKPPPHELRGRDDARQPRQAPSVIDPAPEHPVSRRSRLTVWSDSKLESAFETTFKALDNHAEAEQRRKYEAAYKAAYEAAYERARIDRAETERIRAEQIKAGTDAMAYERARIELIRAYQAKTISAAQRFESIGKRQVDEAERAKLRQRLVAEMEQREYEAAAKERRQKPRPKSPKARREYQKKANRKYRDSLRESEQRLNAILAKRQPEAGAERRRRRQEVERRERERIKESALLPPLPPIWNITTRRVRSRISSLTAENIHQHHLADQAERYFSHLLDQFFPLPKISELEYRTATTPFQTYEADEFAQERNLE